MRKSRWISAAALLAGMAILGASPSQAALVLTITQDGSSATASMDTTTGAISGVVIVGGTGAFASIINPISGDKTLSFAGTIGNVFFDLSTAATTNTPGTPILAKLNLSSNTITNLVAASSAFSIATSATGYTAPSGVVVGDISNSGTLTIGSITGSFTGTADGYTPPTLNFAATGTAVSLANNPPSTVVTVVTPYTMTGTISATLGGLSSTASLGGTVILTGVPEPSTVVAALTGVGLIGLGAVRRKFRNQA